MPQYLAPGVYIEEVSAGPPPIEGVGTNTAGFVGVCRRGRVEGPPTLVTSYRGFVRVFGGAFDFAGFAGLSDLPAAMRGFFDNGGQRAFVARVAAVPDPANDTATGTLAGGIVTRLARDTAIVPAAAQQFATLASLRGIGAGTKLVLEMTRQGVTTISDVRIVTAVDRATHVVTLDKEISKTVIFEAAHTIVHTDLAAVALAADGSATPLGAPTDSKPPTFALSASSAGSWGRDVLIAPAAQSAGASQAVKLIKAAAGANKLQLLSTAGFYVGAWVEIDADAKPKNYRAVLAIDGPVLTLDGPKLDPALVPASPPTRVASCEFALAISYTDPVDGVTVSERYDGLTLASIPGRFYVDRLMPSELVTVTGAPPAATHPLLFPSAPDGIATKLSGGLDTAPNDLDVVGFDHGPNRKTGLLAIEDVDEVAILAAPGLTSQAVQNALINQCERLMDRFAVLDPVGGEAGGSPATPATLVQIEDQRNLYDTKYAAFYYPRVVIQDPFVAGATRTVAPSGHVLGVFSRVDATRGVHKAPANEVLRGILDVETAVSKGTQEILNPRNVNVIRDLRAMQRGVRVYGARCLTGEADWNYVSVRRLFIFIEESLDEGTQWVVFEPNDRRLWARVQQSVSLFLTRLWVDGALMGAKPEEAYYVRVDETTMTDDDILNGRLVMEIGIAPVRPAEFVVIRIGQWLGGSSVQEI